jgi:hypothetical protein
VRFAASTKFWIIVAVGALFAHCTTNTDIGKPCVLVKGTSDGGVTDVLPSDIVNSNGDDIITFGNTSCTSLTCVLDKEAAAVVVPAAQAADAGMVWGYCSKPCSTAISNDCSQLYPAIADQDAGSPMICRSLLLDLQAIIAICRPPTGSVAKCESELGQSDVIEPYFCARGPDVAALPDGG